VGLDFWRRAGKRNR